VTVQGTINGKSFAVSRTVTSTRGQLTFSLDGEDRTALSIKETQQVLDDTLGGSLSLLGRVVFHGQHATNDLLESSDARLKEELSQLVPLSIWQDCAVASRKRAKDTAVQSTQLTGMISLRSSDAAALAGKVELSKGQFEMRKDEHQRLLDMLEHEFVSGKNSGVSSKSFEELEENAQKVLAAVKALETELQAILIERRQQEGELERKISEIDEVLQVALHESEEAASRLRKSSWGLTMAKEEIATMEKTWGVSLQAGRPEGIVLPSVCPLCRQNLDDHRHVEASLWKDIDNAMENMSFRSNNVTAEEMKSAQAQLKLSNVQSQRSELEAKWLYQRDIWIGRQNDTEQRLRECRIQQDDSSEALQTYAKTAAQRSKLDVLRHGVASANERLMAATVDAEAAQVELTKCQTWIDVTTQELQQLEERSALYKTLAEAFGSRGVQSFVLQNALSFLQDSAASYLAQLSQGTQQLELSLDADDRIRRRALVRGADGIWQERALAGLSGGQWRRTSLAVQLAVDDYVRQHLLRSNLVVFDEPLIHLDQTGRSDVGRVLRSLLGVSPGDTGPSTVIVILQDLSADELDEYFDCIDEVVRSDGRSKVVVTD
jgi:DNA repair exonuclease SbcCD ATPase subunit